MQMIHMKYQALFSIKIQVVCCSCDWDLKLPEITDSQNLTEANISMSELFPLKTDPFPITLTMLLASSADNKPVIFFSYFS